MKDILHQNKKGVSEIISYVILIIIAVSIAAIVYTYLSNLVEKEKIECGEGFSLSIEEVSCKYVDPNSYINLTVKNRGRFNIEAAYVRIGEVGGNTKYWINTEDFEYAPNLVPNGASYFKQYYFETNRVLKSGTGEYILEIQLAAYDKELERYASCPNSITKVITCN